MMIAADNMAGFACSAKLLVLYSEYKTKNLGSHATLTFRRV